MKRENINIRPPLVLLIDDDETLHWWAKRALPKAGFEVICCLNGKDGIAAFKESSPDIIIIDIEMPLMDGIATCIEIIKCSNIAPPIAMITGTEDEERIAQSYAAGAAEFIRKPINWQILGYRLHYMLKASKLMESERRLSNAKQMADLGDWEWQAYNSQVYWSDEIYSMVEVGKEDFIPNVRNFKGFIHRSDILHFTRHLHEAIKTKKISALEFRIITANKKERFVSQQVEAIFNYNNKLTGLRGTVHDITERKDQENKIRHLAYYDEVTQLPNRAFFLKFLAKTINLAHRTDGHFAILFLDLDGFKGINDTYGHQAGDLLLREISNRLISGLRCSDLASRYFDHFDHKIDVARFGGDEFVILLNDLTQPEDAATVATRIKCWVTEPVKLGDRLAQVGVTIGIAVYPMDGEDSGTLIKNADIAMYHAKKNGQRALPVFRSGNGLKSPKTARNRNQNVQCPLQ